jgi:hypothetical protein
VNAGEWYAASKIFSFEITQTLTNVKHSLGWWLSGFLLHRLYSGSTPIQDQEFLDFLLNGVKRATAPFDNHLPFLFVCCSWIGPKNRVFL